MGGIRGIDKDGKADQNEKSNLQPSPRRHSIPHQLRQIFDKMASKFSNLVSEPPRQQANGGGKAQAPLDFQTAMMELASPKEKDANEKLLHDLQDDEQQYYPKSGQHFAEDHFSRNVHIINKTRLLKAARDMPKGSHLHIHFNSTLLPEFLLDIAKEMSNMYISSPTHKLRSRKDFDDCEIVFNLQKVNTALKPLDEDVKLSSQGRLSEDSRGPNLFRDNYEPRQQMRYQYFRAMWDEERKLRQSSASQHGKQTSSPDSKVWAMDMECDDWLVSKLIFSKEEVDLIFDPLENQPGKMPKETEAEQEARQKKAVESGWPHDIEIDFQNSRYKNVRERATRAWEKFNGRTRMMKGLFNYEKAFRAYTRRCLEEFVQENVQYAEIRPNFMKSNQVIRDDGSDGFNNFGLMEIIIEEYEGFMKDIGDMNEAGQIIESRKLDSQGKPIYSETTGIPLAGDHTPSFGGMKIIYCTPRSFAKSMVKDALDECIRMKKKWPDYIAGFDLVGEESYSRPYGLRYFEEEFKQFQEDCREENVKIPFLFHCGETPDDIEENLQCALDLNAKRIGHGYALPEKPRIMERMKANKVCVEACPISNMVLGLAERMDEHRIYELLRNEVHCTLNSDNGTIFRSTLSHDFYEVMVGNRNMNLHGWRQLAIWSIDHACMNEVERERVLVEWERRWNDEFIPGLLGKPPAHRPARLIRLDKINENRQKRMAEPKL
ncbi:Metallo-dependent hydrolase [Hypoxylon sp. NC1633]|nr:Metallo-dependent hydrolase [Hypoxylon sp. NC1633]